jgi:hypothetical protein
LATETLIFFTPMEEQLFLQFRWWAGKNLPGSAACRRALTMNMAGILPDEAPRISP